MKDIEYILDFSVRLGSKMLIAGANLERVNDTLTRICKSYDLTDISIFSLSSIIQISARSPEGEYCSRQISIRSRDMMLEKVSSLNRLSRQVCLEKPAPSSLAGLLRKAEVTFSYPGWVRFLGRLAAMSALCLMFGGTWGDVLASDIIVFFLSWIIPLLERFNLNQILVNTFSMLFSGLAGILLVYAGLGQNYFIIAITCSMRLIPGIAMVDAVRNLLCGNEMNGILQMLKAILETLAIVLGQVCSLYLLGGLIAW